MEELAKATGWDVGKIAEVAGVSSSAVSQWFGKGSKLINSIGIAPATKLEQASGYRAMWISKGELPKLAIEKGNVDAARQSAGEVPVISWVQAGSWHDVADTFQPGDAERMLPIFRGHSSNTYALKVRGDSMTAPYGRSYPEGCYVIVDPAKCSPINGDRIIAITPGSKEATFKIYKDEDGRRWLAPLNSTHLTIQEPFEVLGTVIGKWEDE
jgi:SOS-response transcriptional repressor LexA